MSSICILAGQGAIGAERHVLALAERLGATVSQAAKLGKALASGTPDGGKIARRIGVNAVREMI